MWLYKACIDCQPVASEICMQRISQQLIGDAVDMFPGFGRSLHTPPPCGSVLPFIHPFVDSELPK